VCGCARVCLVIAICVRCVCVHVCVSCDGAITAPHAAQVHECQRTGGD
jgi:hypothetical protein